MGITRLSEAAIPDILFRAGTIAGGSCQRTTGDPAKNKCLLSYPCDGKNQIIYAEDGNSSIEIASDSSIFLCCL